MKYKLGLSLSGGGAKGFAHLGVMQLLSEKGLVPDIISGTSAGALAGCLLADGHSPHDIVMMFKDEGFGSFGSFGVPSGGFFKSTPFDSFLKRNLKARNFSQLKTSLRVVATDIEKGRMHEFSEGDLIPAVVSSCCVPIIFSPRKVGNSHFVDGGLFKNLPVSNIREECEFVVGVNVSPIRPVEFRNSFKYVAERTFHYMSSSNTLVDRDMCDVLFESHELSKYSMFDLDNVESIFQQGYTFASELYDREFQVFNKIVNNIVCNEN